MSFVLSSSPLPPGVTDPHFAAALQNGFADYGGQAQTYLVAFEVARSVAPDVVAAELLLQQVLASSPQFHLHPLWEGAASVFGTLTVAAAGLQNLREAVLAAQLLRFEVSLAPADARSAFAVAPPEPVPVTTAAGAFHEPARAEAGAAVLHGIVDFGCPFAHAGLRLAGGGTRLLNFWDQGASLDVPGRASPAAWRFGTAVRHDELENWLTGQAGLEEGMLYRQAGLPELAHRASHGAHLIGAFLDGNRGPSLLWAGRRDSAPDLPDVPAPALRDFVFVQLPRYYQQGVPRCTLAPYRLAALRYILACAGDARTIVVPISSENYDGPHDGSSLFEAALDGLVVEAQRRGRELRVLISAGNGSRAQTHAQLPLAAQVTHRQLVLRVPPGNERPTFVELWLPAGLQPVQFTIQPPGEDEPPQPCSVDEPWTGRIEGHTVFFSVGLPHGRQTCLLLRIAPTLVMEGRGAPAGDWTMQLHGLGGNPGSVFAYVARSTHGLGGHRRSYQAYFVLPFSSERDFTTGDLAVQGKRQYEERSINGLANGQEPWVVGGYRLSDRRRARYSARGPSRSGGRFKNTGVDVAAPSEEAPSLRGIRGWGNASAASVRLGGTSVAAPLAARAARTARLGRAQSTDDDDAPLSRGDVT